MKIAKIILFLALPFLLQADSPPLEVPPLPEIGYQGAFLKMIVAFIALIVGLFFTVWMLKRLSRGRFKNLNDDRAIKILEKRPLSPKTMLYFVEVEGKRALVAESQLEVKSLLTCSYLKDTKEAEE